VDLPPSSQHFLILWLSCYSRTPKNVVT
jgi:hypothetical protein